MRFTFELEAAIMTALLAGPVLIGLLVQVCEVLFHR
jgi:hypothetical protein